MKKPLLPQSDLAKRFCDIFHRRHTTPWTKKEVAKFREIKPYIVEDEMLMLERYYDAERKRGDQGCHRRDLQTLLNNFQSEIDRARAWCERHPIRAVRKIIPLPPIPSDRPPLSPEEQADSDRFLAQYRQRKVLRQAKESA